MPRRLCDAGLGRTADSLGYCRDNRHLLFPIRAAEVLFPGDAERAPHTMFLSDTAGNELWLSGCTIGYVGEGPRAALQILVEEGFPADEAVMVSPHATFTCTGQPTPRLRVSSNRRTARRVQQTRCPAAMPSRAPPVGTTTSTEGRRYDLSNWSARTCGRVHRGRWPRVRRSKPVLPTSE